jgi:hypothetical protein
MKRTIIVVLSIFVVFVAVFSVLVLRPVHKVKAHNGCSIASLKGNYGVVGTGFFGGTGATEGPAATFSAVLTFDGEGDFSGNEWVTIEDNIVRGYPIIDWSFTGGTYTVNPDCSATFTIPAIRDFGGNLGYGWGSLVDTGGDEIFGNLTAGPNPLTGGVGVATATFDAKRIGEGHWNYWGE